MNERTNFLTLLQVSVSPDTPLTVAAEVKILELLGIVSNPDLVKAMQVTLLVVPPASQATLKGLLGLLGGLIKMNPKCTRAHHDSLAKTLDELAAIPDTALTYGTFLAICESLLKSAHGRRDKAAA